jgi:general secretion pathway protein G
MLRNKKGFTLIELLVVISLVGILSVMGLGNYKGSQKRARDVNRQSDLNQYRVALENYSSNNQGTYPASKDSLIPDYLPSRLSPNGGGAYTYYTNNSEYILITCTELNNKIYKICSNGKSGMTTTACLIGTNDTGGISGFDNCAGL